ncbi:hexose transporter [Crepidotus variabilis]|uniref:Hexose transporter n=1 Tax=Crepidotus variabilis TaxID=179855 RepID=A0A9P6ETY2_9AGAR|nr:hexose transporter [Crepidotus variabilis]
MAEIGQEKRGTTPLKEIEPNVLVSELAKHDTTPWYRKPNLRYLYFVLFPTCIGVEMTSGFDSSMMNGLQAVDSWNLFYNHPRSTLLGVMSAMYSAGAIVALPLIPFVSDGLGRRRAILFGSIIMVIGAVLQTAAQNFAMFVVARFILGLGIPFAIVAASSLLGELGHPKERAILGSLFNSCYFIGSIVAAGVTFGTFKMKSNWGWRTPSILQIAPSALQIIFLPLIPESPRWLISKGRGDEAFSVLAKYHAEGDRESELVKAEFIQIERTLELERETAKVGWRDLFKTAGMRRRVLIGSFLGLATQWSGNGLISYFMAPILETIGIHDNYRKNEINLIYSCWGFINATILALTVSRFNRRTAYLACTGSLLLVYTGLTVASARYQISEPKNQAASRTVLAPCYNLAYNALTYTFLVELFPYHSRSKGIAVFQWFSRMAGFFNQFVNPIGLANAQWKFYTSYIAFLAFEVVFVFFLFPETSGRSLEELAFLFEGKEQKEQLKRVEQEIHHHEDQSDEKTSIDPPVKTVNNA